MGNALSRRVVVTIGLCFVAFAITHVTTGVRWQAIIVWIAVVSLGVMVPGWLLVRLARGPRELVSELGLALPVGLVAALAGWALDRVLDIALHPVAWAALLLGLAVVHPHARRRVLARPTGPPWGAGAGVAVVGSVVLSLAWMASSGLAAVPIRPPDPGYFYSADSMFQVAMTSELARELRPGYPFVAGEPISYHWFYYALSAFLGQGLDTEVVVLRLFPTTLVMALVLLTAAAAREIAGSNSAAAIGAVLAGVVGNTQGSQWVLVTGIPGRWDGDGGGLDPVRLYWQHSPTQTLAWVAGLAAMGVIVSLLRQRRATPPQWLLVASLLWLTAGAKSSQLPVLLCGLLLAVLVAGLRRDWRSARLLGLGGGLAATLQVLAALVIYPGGAHGMVVRPGERLLLHASQLMPGLVHWEAPTLRQGPTAPAVAAVAAALVVMLPMTPRLIGVVFLGRLRAADPVAWIGIGALVAGICGTYLTRHPGQSEVFFLVSSYPLALAASAAGFAAALDVLKPYLSRRRRAAGLTAAGTAAGGLVVAFVATGVSGDKHPLARWHAVLQRYPSSADVAAGEQAWAWVQPLVLVAVGTMGLTAVVTALSWRLRQAADVRVAAWAAGVAVVALLGAGVLTTAAQSRPMDGASRQAAMTAWAQDRARLRSYILTTGDFVSAAHAIRDDAQPDDVVATNLTCLVRDSRRRLGAACDPRNFTVSAFTGLRSEVAGWGYSNRAVASAWKTPGGYIGAPFWDEERLAAQTELISRPSRASLDRAWRERGIRWILADTQAGSVSPRLRELADPIFIGGGVHAYRLRSPEGQSSQTPS